MLVRKLAIVLGTVAAACGLSTAQAGPLTAGVSFTDGLQNFGTTTSIVSQMNVADDNPASIDTASSCSGALDAGGGNCIPATGNFASDFNIGALGTQLAYTFDGYSFFVTDFITVSRTPLNCNGTQCFDFLNFAADGYVTGNGIDPTAITLSWSAQGVCNEAGTTKGSGTCAAVTTASWSSSISANGVLFEVPEPGTAALIGVGLIAFGLARRRRA